MCFPAIVVMHMLRQTYDQRISSLHNKPQYMFRHNEFFYHSCHAISYKLYCVCVCAKFLYEYNKIKNIKFNAN